MLLGTGSRDRLKMFFTKKAFTLVELMVAILLSAIIVFFSYTMTISAYKMFTRMNNTSYNVDNVKFFEEVFKKSVSEANNIETAPAAAGDKDEIKFTRYDVNIGNEVTDIYTLDDEQGNRLKFRLDNTTHHYEVYPGNIADDALKDVKPVKLFVETSYGSHKTRMLLLNNVKAFYYRFDKTGNVNNLRDITIGIIYYDDSAKTLKRQNRTFCFTARGVVA